jgi:hypothetical protein
VLALLTCDYSKGIDNYAHFFTADQLIYQASECFKLISLLNKEVKPTVKDSVLNILEKQQHSGTIDKHLDPYRTILRSRPKVQQ